MADIKTFYKTQSEVAGAMIKLIDLYADKWFYYRRHWI